MVNSVPRKFHSSPAYNDPSNVQQSSPGIAVNMADGKPPDNSRGSFRRAISFFSRKNKSEVAPVPQAAPPAVVDSPMVSARATRADEFLSGKRQPHTTGTRAWLAENGLHEVTNPGTNAFTSLAAALIQHAAGYYGPMEGPSANIGIDLKAKILDAIRHVESGINDGTLDTNNKILAAVNREFPDARLAVTIRTDHSDQVDVIPFSPIENEPGLGSCGNGVLLIQQNDRFNAVLADHQMIGSAHISQYQKDATTFHDEHFSRAIEAAADIEHFLDQPAAMHRTGHNTQPSYDNRTTVSATTLNRIFLPSNIERIPNAASADINLITGLLHHATGIYKKEDLPVAGQVFVTDLNPLHTLEARVILEEINGTFPSARHSQPIGSVHNDPRMGKAVELINLRHNVQLNLVVVEARDDGLHRTATFLASPGLDPHRDTTGETSSTIALLHNGNSFEPLRKSEMKTNPELQPAQRILRKSAYGLVKHVMADQMSPLRKVARNMSDDELMFETLPHSTLHNGKRQKALHHELAKRQNADRIDLGTQTAMERLKNRFRGIKHAHNPYACQTLTQLKSVSDMDAKRPLLLSKERMLLQRAMQDKKIAASNVSQFQHTRPVPKPLASEANIMTINAEFMDLVQTVDIEELERNWSTAQFDLNVPAAAEPWENRDDLVRLQSTVRQAWNSSRQGFTNGAVPELHGAIAQLKIAQQQFEATQAQLNASPHSSGTEQFQETGRKIGQLIDHLTIHAQPGAPKPLSTEFNAFKQRERQTRESGGTTTAAHATLVSQKAGIFEERMALQKEIDELMQNPREGISLAEFGLTPDSPPSVPQVLDAYKRVETKMVDDRNGISHKLADDTRMHDNLSHTIPLLHSRLDYIATSRNPMPDPTPYAIANDVIEDLKNNHLAGLALPDEPIAIQNMDAATVNQLKNAIEGIGLSLRQNIQSLKGKKETMETKLACLRSIIEPILRRHDKIDRSVEQIKAREQLVARMAQEKHRVADSEREAAISAAEIRLLQEKANLDGGLTH